MKLKTLIIFVTALMVTFALPHKVSHIRLDTAHAAPSLGACKKNCKVKFVSCKRSPGSASEKKCKAKWDACKKKC